MFFLQEFNVLDWVKSPIWEFVSAIISLIAIIVPIYFYFSYQREKKGIRFSFKYDFISNSLIEGVGLEKDKLKIQFDGQYVSNINHVSLVIWNSGNQPIKVEDYEQPITINFGEKAKILSGSGITEPNDIKAVLIRKTDSIIEIEPTLLNGGDTFYLYFLVSQFTGKLEVGGRIVGVENIKGTDLVSKEKKYYNSHQLINSYILYISVFFFNWVSSVTSTGWMSVRGALFCGWALANIFNLVYHKKYKSTFNEFVVMTIFMSLLLYLFALVLNYFSLITPAEIP